MTRSHAFQCLLIAVLFLLSVSVQPVMAAEEINKELHRIQTLQDPGSSSITIREIEAGRLRAHTESAGSIRQAGASVITIRTGNVELVTRDPLAPSLPMAGIAVAEGAGSGPMSETSVSPGDMEAEAQLKTEFANMTARGFVQTGESRNYYETKLHMEELRNASSLQRSQLEEKGYTFESEDTLRSEHAVRYFILTNPDTGSHILMMAVRHIDTDGNPYGKQVVGISPEYDDEGQARVHAATMENSGVAAPAACHSACFTEYMEIIREYIALALAFITAILEGIGILIAIVGATVFAFGGIVTLGVVGGAIDIGVALVDGIERLLILFIRIGADPDAERKGDLYMRKQMPELRKTIVVWNTLVPGHDNLFGPLMYAIYRYNVCRCLIEPVEGGPAVFLWDYQYRFSEGDTGKIATIRQFDLFALRLFVNTTAGSSGSWIMENHGNLTQKDSVTVTTNNGTFNAWLFEATKAGAQNITLRYDAGTGSTATAGLPDRYYLTLNVRQSPWNITQVDITPPQNREAGNGMYTSLVFGKEGTPHISYYAPTWGAVRYATRTSDGWKAVTVSGSRGTFRTSIDLSPKGGYPAFTYSDSDPTWNIGDMNYAYWDGKKWNWEHVITPGGGSDFRSIGMYNSLRFDSGGNPHVAFNSGQDLINSLWYATRGYDKKWHVSNIRPPLGEDTGNNPSLALTHNDKARIAYRAGITLLNRQVLYSKLWYGEEKDNGAWNFETVDDGGFLGKTGHFASLALDSHDNPHIAYYDENMQRLRYAHRDEQGKWSLATVDNGADVGSWCSIALDKTDTPHIAYYDKSAGHLKYAVFDRNAGDWVDRTIDTNGNVGACTSIAVNPRGHPCISYLDYTHAALKFACEEDDILSRQNPIPTTTPTLSPTATQTPVPTYTGTTIPPTAQPTAVLTEVPTSAPTPQVTVTPAGAGQSDPADVITATSPGSSAGSTVSYSFNDAASADPWSVKEVSFVPGQTVPESRCTVRKDSPLPDFRLQGSPAQYRNIEIGWVNPTAISEATIGFSVTKAWLDENHIDPANVVMMRQHDLAWAELPTTFNRQEGDRYYYTAITPGFSYFAVTDKTTATAATAGVAVPVPVTPAPAPINSKAEEVKTAPAEIPSSVTGSAKGAAMPARVAPAVTGTPVPVPAAAEPASGLPLLWIAVAGLVSVLGIAGFFIGRRMWWAHQNPALFRKYD